MEIFKTHPSVRVKGTEDNYEPVACTIRECPKRSPHMHCPFCLKGDSFIDPVILKAHYRVKHVDKGIEFAGLKILRCCDQCSIVGSIKDSKEFKGAHWHCYNCRNGFNRRDEALKHYKTHFRNPMTTFQIQITHDINSQMMRLPQQVEFEHALDTLPEDSGGGGLILPKTHPWVVSNETIISSVADGADVSHEESVLNSTHESSTQEISLTSADGVPRLILVEPHQQVSGGKQDETQYFIVGDDGKLTAANATVAASQQQVLADNLVQTDQFERDQLLARISELQTELSDTETLYQQKVASLENQVDEQNKKITALEQREQELLNQLRQNLSEEQVSDILSEMKSKQEELLNQCLNKLKLSKPVSTGSAVPKITNIQSSQSSISESCRAMASLDDKSCTAESTHSEDGNVIDSTSDKVLESTEIHQISHGSIKVESMSAGLSGTSSNSSPVNVDIGIHPINNVSEIFVNTTMSDQLTTKDPKVVKMPLSRLFTSDSPGASGADEDVSSQGQQVYFLVQSDGTEVPLLEGQNGVLLDRESVGQHSEADIAEAGYQIEIRGGYNDGLIGTHTNVDLVNHRDNIVRTGALVSTDPNAVAIYSEDIIRTGPHVSTSNGDVNTYSDDIIRTGGHASTSNGDVTTYSDDIIKTGGHSTTGHGVVITEVSTTGIELDRDQPEVIENVEYSSDNSSNVYIVPNSMSAVSEHQYAVVEQNVEIQGDGESDLKVISVRRGKRKASASPVGAGTPSKMRVKRLRKPSIKDSL